MSCKIILYERKYEKLNKLTSNDKEVETKVLETIWKGDSSKRQIGWL